MKSKIFILLIVLLNFSSCSFRESKIHNTSDIIPIELSTLEKIDPFTSSNNHLNKYRLLRLETIDDCLIKWIEKIIVDENFLFIKDSNHKLYVFDLITGHFLNSIGKIGAGPTELLTFVDFYIDSIEKAVFIYDMSKSKMFKYSYRGDLLEILNCSDRLFSDFTNLSYVRDGDIILTMFNNSSVRYNYKVLGAGKYNLKGEYLPYCATGFLNLVFKDQKVACNKTDCYAVTYLSDTIYQYTSKDGFYPKYIFNSSLKHVESNTFKEVNSFEIALEAATLLKKKGFSPGILELYATDELLYFPYYLGTDEYKIYWNIKKQKGYYIKNYINMDPVKSLDNIIAATNDALIRVIPSEELLNVRDKYEYTIEEKEFLKKIKEEDNPILAFYYIH
ncbi:6-bladed beta-propeller [Bacteroides sp. CG01]|uniref:6-bladed beta-propeller n=1 Tax=Bacteroides sp. CG01 TaxID=3096000 RepID=UPI002AFECFBD|nr:6-bladed beta-propeller [Bacteroides sp. CG01]